jgi:serine phosphatase RsbU (regulator of sigma subunit)
VRRPAAGGDGNLLDQIGRDIPLALPIPDWSKPIILGLLLLTTAFAVHAGIVSRRVRRLKHEQRELAADLSSMQSALVPEIPRRIGDLSVSVAYRPADGPGAGGDFYDAFPLRSGRVAIILGDASGHGRAALAHATEMHFTLRAYVESGLGPRDALKLASRVFAKDDDDLFTTVVIAVYDPEAASLTYAISGHPHPLMLGHPAREPAMSCSSPPLGWGTTNGWRETTVPFPSGARACFYTDGLTEAPTEQGLLGRSRLGQMFFELGPSPSAVDLLERVRADARETRDDMAACVIEALTGDTLTDTLVEEIEVGLDPLGVRRVRRFLQDCELWPNEIGSVLAQARDIAFEHQSALVTVHRTASSSTATATAPRSVFRANGRAGAPSLEALTELPPGDSTPQVPVSASATQEPGVAPLHLVGGPRDE